MIKVNRKWFEERKACKDGYKWVCDQIKPEEEKPLLEILNQLIMEDRLDWCSWALSRAFPTQEQKIKYAIFAAEQVLHIYESENPGDERPKQAIEAAKKVLEHSTSESPYDPAICAETASCTVYYATRIAAYYTAVPVAHLAAGRARDAANIDSVAASAAACAASVAACAASYAAYTAANPDSCAASAADCAADCAASAAASYDQTFNIILTYGINLLTNSFINQK